MPENLELEKQLKLAKRTGSYLVGRREVMSGLKGSKLLVWSDSSNLPQAILDQSRDLSVPAIKFAGNPVELGHACGIPFRVSVIAVKSPGDADLSGFAKSADYLAVFSGARSLAVEKPEEHAAAPEKVSKESKAKPKKVSKEKETDAEAKVPGKKSRKSEAKTEEKESDAPKSSKEKKAKTAKKSSESPEKSKKKKAKDEE